LLKPTPLANRPSLERFKALVRIASTKRDASPSVVAPASSRVHDKLTRHPSQCFDEFRDLSVLFAFVPRNDRMLDAMSDVILDDLVFDACERGTNSRNLNQYVDAVAIVIDHPRDAADLTFDTVQPLQTALFGFC
jgi:hypothetical protein